MTPHYLEHLASLGVTDLHPLGRQATWSLLSALQLQTGQRILEIGCGTGGTMVLAASQTAVYVDGIDPLPAMLQVAQKRLRLTGCRARTTLTQANGTTLPFPDQTYDRVYTESVLGFQNTAAAQAISQQIFRVLKPGGLYVANEAVWKPAVTTQAAADIYEACMVDFGISQASVQAWGVDNWVNMMKAVGFQVVSADLWEDWPEEKAQPDSCYALGEQSQRLRWACFVSNWLTRLYRMQRFFVPRMAQLSWQYRQHLAQHQHDGHLIESRLFILEKPEKK